MMPTGWSFTVGTHPDLVEVYEDLARKGVVYLRWRVTTGTDARKYTRRSLGFTLRNAKGKVERALEARAREAAQLRYRELMGVVAVHEQKRALTIIDGMRLAFDPLRGRWVHDTQHRKEIERAVLQACSVWGADRAWATIKKQDFRELWRRTLKQQRAAKHSGHRATEIVIARLLTLAAWLREEDEIPPVAWLPWKHWKEEVREDVGDVEVFRPRFTLDEMRALLRTARHVDPRWDLLLQLGAGLRLGQVVRAQRSWLDRLKGQLNLRRAGRKHKKGAVRMLTAGQLAAFDDAVGPDGYLFALEQQYLSAGVDYPLWPDGALPRRHDGRVYTTARHATRGCTNGRTLQTFFVANEVLAGIVHQEGRGWTGLRRVTVDQGKEAKISREALKELGGWADTQMADRIYTDEELQAPRDEARELLAKIRGEVAE
jgi:hypothetical protein